MSEDTNGPCPFCGGTFLKSWSDHFEHCDMFNTFCLTMHYPPVRMVILDTRTGKTYLRIKLNETFCGPREISHDEAMGYAKRRREQLASALANHEFFIRQMEAQNGNGKR